MTKVVNLPKRKPSAAEMEWYRRITRGWSDEMRRLICPDYWAADRK